MSTTEPLLACPFCGGEAELGSPIYYVECTSCRGGVPSYDSRDEAIAAWNRRATPPVNADPVAYGEDIDGRIVSARRDMSRHCTVPLYRTPPAPNGWQPTYRHKKRGTTYRVEGIASLQTASPCEETAVLVIYRGEDGKLHARPHDEFYDGRFEATSAAPTEARDE